MNIRDHSSSITPISKGKYRKQYNINNMNGFPYPLSTVNLATFASCHDSRNAKCLRNANETTSVNSYKTVGSFHKM